MRCYALLMLLAAFAGCSDAPELAEPALFEEGPPLVSGEGKMDALGAEIPAYAPLSPLASLDGEFEALFAPDDPVSTAEVSLIQRIIDARLADARDFVEGENPYRIRYAVYNLRNPYVIEALADAEDAGVDVQVLIESDQLDPARDYNVGDERLIERGFEFAPDHRELRGDEFATADLVGIVGSGLMHLKTRIFETPNDRVVLSGSLNPGDNAVLNEETLHLIRDRDIVERYVGAYDAILHRRAFQNVWDDGAAVNVLFTPASTDRAVGHVFDWLAAEEEQILLMVFSLRDITAPGHDRSLVELLADKAAEGVDVWVITDRKQSDGVDAAGNYVARNDDMEDRLRAAGIHVYEATNYATDFTAMHHKVAVLGRTNIRVITDAANWTLSGLGSATRKAKNMESQLFIDSGKLDDNRTGRRYLAQWMRVASRYADQGARDGEPGYAQIWEALATRPDWPAQDVEFTAFETTTEFGESVYVRGSAGELGAWQGDGHLLATDESSYPTWSSPAPLTMPLGAAFEWKLTATFPDRGDVRWESGDNRAGFAQPSALQATSSAHHTGVFE